MVTIHGESILLGRSFKLVLKNLRKESKDLTDFPKLKRFIKNNPRSLAVIGLIFGMNMNHFSKFVGLHGDTIGRYACGKFRVGERALKKIVPKVREEIKHWYFPDRETLKYRYMFLIRHKKESINEWMKSRHLTREDLSRAFKEFVTASNNFSRITPKVIKSVPRSILVLRSILGFSQREFAELLGFTRTQIVFWEQCLCMPRANSDLIAQKVAPLLKGEEISLEKAMDNFETIRDPSKFAQKIPKKDRQEFAIRMLKLASPYLQEKKMSEILAVNGIDFIQQYPLIGPSDKGGEASMLIVDFAIPQDQPRVIIEASNFPNHRGVIKLAWKAYRIQKYRPNIVKICIINEVRSHRMRHKKGIDILTEAFDYVIDHNDYEKLVEILNERGIFGRQRTGKFVS